MAGFSPMTITVGKRLSNDDGTCALRERAGIVLCARCIGGKVIFSGRRLKLQM